MITTNDLKNGMTLLLDGMLFEVVEFQHIKPGKGHAFVRTKLRSVQTGRIMDRNFRSKEPVEQAYIEKKFVEYLYRAGDAYHVMDPETYDQIAVAARLFEGKDQFLKENMEIMLTFHGSTVIDVSLPDTVELKVTSAPPGVRGDTATNVTKSVTLETGAVIQAPLFIAEGDVVRVDTRTGGYVTRVQ
jgi:elongation factor P